MFSRLFLAAPLNYSESAKGYDEKDLQKELSRHPANDTKINDILKWGKLLNLSVSTHDLLINTYVETSFFIYEFSIYCNLQISDMFLSISFYP